MNESSISAPHPTATWRTALCMVMVSVVKTWEESGEVAGTVGHLEGHYVVRLQMQMYSLCSYSYTGTFSKDFFSQRAVN